MLMQESCQNNLLIICYLTRKHIPDKIILFNKCYLITCVYKIVLIFLAISNCNYAIQFSKPFFRALQKPQ